MWLASDGGEGDLRYVVERSSEGSPFGVVGETADTWLVDLGVTPGTTYTYRVTVRDAAGSTATSEDLDVATPHDPSGVPAWNPMGAYERGDEVSRAGQVYQAVQDHTGNGDPTWITAPSLWRTI